MNPFRRPEEIMQMAAVGDLIEFERGKYKHWAVFVGPKFIERGDGVLDYVACVVHYSDGTVGDFHSKNASNGKGPSAVVRVQSFEEVASNNLCRINNALDSIVDIPFTGEQIMERAYSEVGKCGYSLWFNNCEHFCNWCRYDRKQSQQSRDAGWMLVYMDTVIFITMGAIALVKVLRS